MGKHEPLHPASAQTLIQLVKLHGAALLIEAIQQIEKNNAVNSTRMGRLADRQRDRTLAAAKA
jgi:hypothetical protein